MEKEKRNLIDRDELIDSLGVSDMEIFAKEVISEAPFVDAVEVVYCKDCTRCKKGFCTIRKDGWGATLKVGLHDFCSYGERKDHA